MVINAQSLISSFLFGCLFKSFSKIFSSQIYSRFLQMFRINQLKLKVLFQQF